MTNATLYEGLPKFSNKIADWRATVNVIPMLRSAAFIAWSCGNQHGDDL